MFSDSIRSPSSLITAGATTTAYRPARATTPQPAYAIERRKYIGNTASAPTARNTVHAENRIVRPAVATARRRASSRFPICGVFLAVPADEQQRVVDRESQAHGGGEVEREDRHVGEKGDPPQHAERPDDGHHADHQWQQRGEQPAEHPDEDDERQRQGDGFGASRSFSDWSLISEATIAVPAGQHGQAVVLAADSVRYAFPYFGALFSPPVTRAITSAVLPSSLIKPALRAESPHGDTTPLT